MIAGEALHGRRDRGPGMIRRCPPADFEEMYEIINDAAQAYQGVIPEGRWKEPYLPKEELNHEIMGGVILPRPAVLY